MLSAASTSSVKGNTNTAPNPYRNKSGSKDLKKKNTDNINVIQLIDSIPFL
jgi:hypothetical protein